MTDNRGRRAGVEDRWTKTIRLPDGATKTVRSATHGKRSRWRARYVGDHGREYTKAFARKTDAQAWLNEQISDQVTGAWTDPAKSGVTFGTMAERWIGTKATRAPKTVAGYRGLLDTLILSRWADVPLRDIAFDDVQEWVSGLSVNGSTRRHGRGLSASRVIQAHRVLSQVLA